jgi:hypothetical protein
LRLFVEANSNAEQTIMHTSCIGTHYCPHCCTATTGGAAGAAGAAAGGAAAGAVVKVSIQLVFRPPKERTGSIRLRNKV